jgi:predicted glycosyltransferase
MRPLLYYVHHQGLGHWRRALAVAAHLSVPVVFASSTPPPRPLPSTGRFVRLPLDHSAATAMPAPDAQGQLHWAPLHQGGLLERHRQLLAAATRNRPVLAVVDVSVEVTVLLRTSGIPVIAVRLPGEREDPPHRLGFALADRTVMPVPAEWGLHAGLARTEAVGLVAATYPPSIPHPTRDGRQVLVIVGRGGSRLDETQCARIAAELPDHQVRVLGLNPPLDRATGNLTFAGQVDDPRSDLATASVVIGNAGLGTVGDVVTASRPFVVLPEDRPYGEQAATGRALAAGEAAVVLSTIPGPGAWKAAVTRAQAAGAPRLRADGATRFARLIEEHSAGLEPIPRPIPVTA